MSNKKGFTLIELLVTMTIIAVLAGLALVSYEGTRKSARDSKRKTDLEQIRSALEMYRSDFGIYPVSNPGLSTLVTTYLPSVPADSISGRLYGYTRPTASTYILCAALERTAACADCGVCVSCGTAACNYRVNSP